MKSTPPKKCPDCQKDMRRIRLVDATERATGGRGAVHVDVAYAADYSEGSYFTGTIPLEGVIRGMICPDCGRVVLYGQKLSM